LPALTQPYESFEKPGLVVNYRLAAVNVYKGALVGVNAAGFLTPMSPGSADLKFVGVANESVDNGAGAAGDRAVNTTKTGAFVLKAASGFSPTVADIGKVVYAASDWEVQASTAGLTHAYAIGTITAIEPTFGGEPGVRVRIDIHTV